MGYADRRPARGRAVHAGLLPPRHPRGRADPHLPDRAGGPPRQARGRADQASSAFAARPRSGYRLKQGRIDVADAGAFLKDPLNILRLFEEALRTGYLLHPNVMRLVASNLHLIDDDLRDDPEATRIFLEPAAGSRQPGTRAAADERGGRARRLHPGIRTHRRDDAVQHVPPLHGGRAHHPDDLDARPDRARRAGRGSAGRPPRS